MFKLINSARNYRLIKNTQNLAFLTLRLHGSHNSPPAENEEHVKFKFQFAKGDGQIDVRARIGESILEVAHNNEIDLEGACESSLACSTCHVILESDLYDTLEEPCEEEEDLLDLAYGLTHTSRLGCQVYITKEMEGMTVKLPSATRNFYVDKSKIGL